MVLTRVLQIHLCSSIGYILHYYLGASYCKVLWVTKHRLNSGAKMYKNVYLRIKNTWLCVCVSVCVCVCYRWECLESLGTVILDGFDKVGLSFVMILSEMPKWQF